MHLGAWNYGARAPPVSDHALGARGQAPKLHASKKKRAAGKGLQEFGMVFSDVNRHTSFPSVSDSKT